MSVCVGIAVGVVAVLGMYMWKEDVYVISCRQGNATKQEPATRAAPPALRHCRAAACHELCVCVCCVYTRHHPQPRPCMCTHTQTHTHKHTHTHTHLTPVEPLVTWVGGMLAFLHLKRVCLVAWDPEQFVVLSDGS